MNNKFTNPHQKHTTNNIRNILNLLTDNITDGSDLDLNKDLLGVRVYASDENHPDLHSLKCNHNGELKICISSYETQDPFIMYDKLYNNQIKLNSTTSNIVTASTTGTISIDEDDREGWKYVNTTLGDKLLLYYYDGTNRSHTLNDLKGVGFNCILDNYTDEGDVPYISVYTKTQGDGNDYEVWYRSRINYAISNLDNLFNSNTMFYNGNRMLHKDLMNFKTLDYDSAFSVGPQANSEEILYIAISSSSSSSAGNTNLLLKNIYYDINNIYTNIKLIT